MKNKVNKKIKRNININHERLKEDVKSIFAPVAKNEEVLAWVNKNLYNWIFRTAPVRPILGLPDNPPEWLVKRFLAGEPLFEVKLDNNFITKVSHAIDYLNEEDKVPDRLSVEDTLIKAANWSYKIEIETKNLEGEGASEPVYAFENGYQFVKLISKEAFTREGNKMGHCVAGYYDRSASGCISIYSLRDEKNEPHVTIEVNGDGKIIQIQGKGNKVPVERYLSMTSDFIIDKSEDLNIVLDERFCKMLSIVKVGDKYFNEGNLPDFITYSGDVYVSEIVDGRKGRHPRGLRVFGKVFFRGFIGKKVDFSIEAHTVDLSESEVESFDAELNVKVVKASYSKLSELPSGLSFDAVYLRGLKMEKFPDIEVSKTIDIRKVQFKDTVLPKLNVDTLDIRGSNITALSSGTKITEFRTKGVDVFVPDDCEIEMYID